MIPWYDSHYGLEARVKDGLSGLLAIQRARREAGYERKERMGEWVLLGRYMLDSCGNFMPIEEGAPADADNFRDYKALPELKSVMAKEDALRISQRWSMPMGGALPPSTDTRCDRCEEGFDYSQAQYRKPDYHSYRDSKSESGWGHRHGRCHRLAVIEREHESFTSLFAEAGIPVESMTMVPSRYHGDDTFFGPWFFVQTERGRILIGWRKRVINIDWSRASFPDRRELFASEDVTKGPYSIHAWGREKALDYLKALWGTQTPAKVG